MLAAIRSDPSMKNDLTQAGIGCEMEEIRSFSSFFYKTSMIDFFLNKKTPFSFGKRRLTCGFSLYMIQFMIRTKSRETIIEI
ncbi:hypothetical protein BTA30_13330 [Bacillus swezeyi]|uniref:Uncharacterized protein n=1 Tax=Bacillus swezeyi TaxID=1925020 RepID=A0A1R1RU11_9BACI|nr:hypothetical protein BW143_19360 [Bacillus swezeyi]OMI29505.1 hypothetical protein BTA30_13330 [Bacillus swezeyi]